MSHQIVKKLQLQPTSGDNSVIIRFHSHQNAVCITCEIWECMRCMGISQLRINSEAVGGWHPLVGNLGTTTGMVGVTWPWWGSNQRSGVWPTFWLSSHGRQSIGGIVESKPVKLVLQFDWVNWYVMWESSHVWVQVQIKPWQASRLVFGSWSTFLKHISAEVWLELMVWVGEGVTAHCGSN